MLDGPRADYGQLRRVDHRRTGAEQRSGNAYGARFLQVLDRTTRVIAAG